MSPTQKPPTVSQALATLAQVATQVEEDKGRDSEVKNKARACNRYADFLAENKEMLVSLGAVSETVDSEVEQAKAFGNLFAPQADLNWDKAEVAQLLAYLDAMVPFGSLDDEQLSTLEGIRETIESASKGTGSRAERKPQERIEGRPERVTVTFGGAVRSNQAGNLPNSISNIKNAAIRTLNAELEKEGKQLTDEHAEQIHKAIKTVVEDGNATAEVLGITFTAAAESTESVTE